MRNLAVPGSRCSFARYRAMHLRMPLVFPLLRERVTASLTPIDDLEEPRGIEYRAIRDSGLLEN